LLIAAPEMTETRAHELMDRAADPADESRAEALLGNSRPAAASAS
jgi:hypothetical protein